VTRNELIKRICTSEGKMHEASVGDVREIVSIIERDLLLLAYFGDAFEKKVEGLKKKLFKKFQKPKKKR
jgi:hypothetical protein